MMDPLSHGTDGGGGSRTGDIYFPYHGSHLALYDDQHVYLDGPVSI